jgi:hypothetical protein
VDAEEGEPAVRAPSAFMKLRRPNLYSDSVQEPMPPWDEAQFAHFLSEITARKEEVAFERFARALAEAKICPNLLPQTGPTGGGDSKVDSETIPVADEIADRWYEGSAGEARSERWAFAFSAKKAWRQKFEKDCVSIKSTGRGYKRIYFITNQSVSDKRRSEAEGEVARKINKGTRVADRIDVRILDRTWIKEVMFDPHHDRWPLVEEAFQLHGLARRYEPRRGPEDARAHVRLTELDKEIADPAKFQGAPVQLIEAWSASAILARRLGHNRESVEGRFNRALAISEKLGLQRVSARIRYDLAWSSYWWFDDASAVIGHYDAIVSGVPDEEKNARDLEQLTNLYSVLSGAVRNGWLSSSSALLQQRAERLDAIGLRISDRRSHPTEAAWAKSQIIFRRLIDNIDDPEAFRESLGELWALLPEIRRLEEYPLTQLVKFVEVVSEFGPWSETLDEISECMTTLMHSRAGDQASGAHLLNRARQSLRNARPYDAIKLLGRAWEKLHRREARDAYVFGSLIAAECYESIGLLWAARAHLLLALRRALRDLEEDGTLGGQELFPLEMLARIELGLGRVTEFLETERLVRAAIIAKKCDEAAAKEFEQRRLTREMLLGALVLRASERDLDVVVHAPAVFEAEDQEIAAEVARFMLGNPESLQQATEMFGGDIGKFLQLPATQDLPNPIWGSGDRVLYSTEVAGCKVEVDVPNTVVAKSIGEAIVAPVEAFLATAMLDHLAPSTDLLRVQIELDFPDSSMHWSAEEDDEGRPVLSIRFGDGVVPIDGGPVDYEAIASAVAVVVSHASIPNDDLDRLWSEDRMHERAFALVSSISASARLFGLNSRCSWASLARSASTSRYERSSWWVAPSTLEKRANMDGSTFDAPDTKPFNLRTENPPQPDHRRVHNAALIHTRIWERAQWRGVAFETAEDPNGAEPGIAGIIIGCLDPDAAAKIHRGLLRRLGPTDRLGQLRVSFVTGIDRRHPAHYRVMIGPDFRASGRSESDKFVLGATRIHTMEPEQLDNLDRFWRVFSDRGWCYFKVVGVQGNNGLDPSGIEPILIRNVIRKEAWEIRPGELEQIAIRGDDSPIVPLGVESRINEILEYQRRRDRTHTRAQNAR